MVIRPESAPDATGEVVLELSSGQRIRIELDRRFFRVLRILIEAALHDQNLTLAAKGLRSKEAIARRYAEQANESAVPANDVIKSYVAAIRKAFKRAVEDLIAKANIFPLPLQPEVIATIWGDGYRIGDINVILIDHTAAE
jgi:hypothetical protein